MKLLTLSPTPHHTGLVKDIREPSSLFERAQECSQCGGMEIPCRLVFSCSSKVKINRLKELVESKIRR